MTLPSSLVWVTVTVLAYLTALWLHRVSGRHPLVNPMLVSVTLMVVALWGTGTSYETYFAGAQFVHFLVGPATVALAIPLYAQIGRLRTLLAPLGVALVVGSTVAIASAVVIGWVCGASPDILRSLAPKSATMPIAMAVSEKIGGVASLSAVTVTLTGLAGAMMARPLLDLLGVDDEAVRGFATGLTAHAIGTASALQSSEAAGAFSALAMSLNGVATTALVPLLVHFLPIR